MLSGIAESWNGENNDEKESAERQERDVHFLRTVPFTSVADYIKAFPKGLYTETCQASLACQRIWPYVRLRHADVRT